MSTGGVARVGVFVSALALLAAGCTREQADTGGGGGAQEAQSLFDEVVERGTLRCGVNESVPGFGFRGGAGEIEGFDIDFCKAIAAAVFNTPDVEGKFELVPVIADDRFTALRAGQYDVLVRNTTWTSSRDGNEGVAFAHVNFYDSQGMFVSADSEFQEVAEMDGAPVCVTTGTTTELNLADYAQELGIELEAVTFDENPQLQEAFLQGRCDGWTSDRSQLAGLISQWPEEEGGPESLRLLPDIMSKEPLAPAVLDGDTKWYDAVNWVVNGLILSEELGVSSENVQQQVESPDSARVAALLGVPFEEGGALDSGLPLDPTFMQSVLQAVGNYGEIYDRHVGSEGLGLERDLNALWSEGGLQYAPPFR